MQETLSIQHLSNTQIDKVRWDAQLANCINRLPYAYSAFLDIVSPGWEAFVADDYRFFMPICPAKKGGITYLLQPPFCQQLGLFFVQQPDVEIIEQFLQTIFLNFRFAEFNLNSANRGVLMSAVSTSGINLELDLSEPYDTIYKNYSKNCKRNLKKAVKSGVSLETSLKGEEIIALFRTNKGAQVSAWGDSEYATLLTLINDAENRDYGFCLGVKSAENELIAGAFFLTDERRTIFLFSGSNSAAKESGAMFFLLDAAIQKSAESGVIFDFEGSNTPSLARFYAGFGAIDNPYPIVKYNNLPLWQRFGVRTFKFFNSK